MLLETDAVQSVRKPYSYLATLSAISKGKAQRPCFLAFHHIVQPRVDSTVAST